VVAGQTLTEAITVTNNGSSAAVTPAITTTLPANTTFQSVIPPVDWACTTPNVGGTGTISCTSRDNFATRASARFVLTLNVVTNAPDTSTISATVTTGSPTNDPNQTNNASMATVAVATVADLTVSDAAPNSVVAGQDVTYTTTLTNNGPSDAANVAVTATVPAGTTFGSFTASGWMCGVPDPSGVVSCGASAIPAGYTVSFPLVVHVAASTPAGVTLTSDTGVSADTHDPDMSNNTASAGAQVITHADLRLTEVAASLVTLSGRMVTYTATFTNAGPSDAQAVVFAESAPSDTSFVAITAPAGWTCTAPTGVAVGTVFCTASTLAVGATGSIVLTVRVNPGVSAGDDLAATSSISSATGDTNTSNNNSTARVPVLQAPPTATPAPSTAPTAAATNALTAPADTATPSPVPPTATPLSTISVTLAPSSTTRYVGIPDTLTVLVTRGGAPMPDLPVTCRVISGPNAGLGMPGMTNAHGQAPCSFTSRKVGTDTVVASVTDVTVAPASNRVRVQWAPAGPPCAVQADLLTGPVLTHDPAYHGRLIDGALGRGRCAAVAALTTPRRMGQAHMTARPSAPAACAQGWAAVSSYDYTITDPTGAVTRTPRLAGHVLPGDTIRASFTIKPRPTGCATVRVSLATYAAPSLTHDAHALSQQALYQSATGLFGAGAHNLALQVDVPARPLAVSADTPSPVRPRIAGGLVRRPLVVHDRARLLMRAVQPLD